MLLTDVTNPGLVASDGAFLYFTSTTVDDTHVYWTEANTGRVMRARK
jgi:hypothetical protein